MTTTELHGKSDLSRVTYMESDESRLQSQEKQAEDDKSILKSKVKRPDKQVKTAKLRVISKE